MAQQTAVEWLVKKISDQYNKSNKIHTAFIRQIIDKAKEIEKQQIIDAVTYGNILEFYDGTEIEIAEQYYNETYNR